MSSDGLEGFEVNEDHEGRDDAPQAAETGSTANTDDALTDSERERIRAEEIRSEEERKYREEVRQEVRREASSGSTWARVLAMLKLEPGISEEIAADPNGTRQGLIVFVVGNAAASIWLLPIILITVPIGLLVTAIYAGLLCLLSRLFSNDVPPYPNWFRTLLFTSAPSALGIIPFIGGVVGGIYVLVLQVVAIRDLARITTGAAVVVWLVVVLLPLMLVVAAADPGIPASNPQSIGAGSLSQLATWVVRRR